VVGGGTGYEVPRAIMRKCVLQPLLETAKRCVDTECSCHGLLWELAPRCFDECLKKNSEEMIAIILCMLEGKGPSKKRAGDNGE
jgi:hypothetical protein